MVEKRESREKERESGRQKDKWDWIQRITQTYFECSLQTRQRNVSSRRIWLGMATTKGGLRVCVCVCMCAQSLSAELRRQHLRYSRKNMKIDVRISIAVRGFDDNFERCILTEQNVRANER